MSWKIHCHKAETDCFSWLRAHTHIEIGNQILPSFSSSVLVSLLLNFSECHWMANFPDETFKTKFQRASELALWSFQRKWEQTEQREFGELYVEVLFCSSPLYRNVVVEYLWSPCLPESYHSFSIVISEVFWQQGCSPRIFVSLWDTSQVHSPIRTISSMFAFSSSSLLIIHAFIT